MPTYDIELFWQCHNCTHIVGGLKKACDNCGKPRTEKELDIWPDNLSQANAIRDPEKIKQARAGADWKCKFCGSSQKKLDGSCQQCGSDQRQGREVHQDRKGVALDGDTDVKLEEHVIKDTPAPESTVTAEQMVKEDMDEDGIPIEATVPSSPSALFKAAAAKQKEPNWEIPKTRIRPSWPIGIGIALVFAVLFYFLFRTKIVESQVSSVSWNRVVHVDRYQVYHRDGWSPDFNAFNVRDDGQRIHHYDHVRVGSHNEHYSVQVACGQNCRTPSCYTTSKSCTSNKNGTATCTGGDRVCPSPVCTTKYCSEPRTRTVDDYEDQPRYRTWYDWSVWDWGHNRDVTASGATTEVAWPRPEQIHLNAGLQGKEEEREAGRDESWQVVFAGKGDTWKYTPSSVEEFQRYPVGSRYKIKVNLVGQVEVLPGK